MRIETRFQDKFDFGSFIAVIVLMCIGIAAIYSATRNLPAFEMNYIKQIIFAVFSIVMYIGIIAVSNRFFRYFAPLLYIIFLVLLVLVIIIGKTIGGAKSWLAIGPLSFQPSEPAKLMTILMLARFLSRPQTNIESLKDISIALAIGITPVILIMLEPDLGSSFIFLFIILTMLYWKGISLFGLMFVLSPFIVAIAALFNQIYFFVLLGVILLFLILMRKDILISSTLMTINIASGYFIDFLYNILSPHQRARINTIKDPNADPLGAGYNSMQAKIAIGSGGLFGKGYLCGNQTQLHFIPEQWTDFIFCGIGEEFGLFGCGVVIGLFTYLFMRIFRTAISARDEYSSLVVIGILSVFVGHFIINIGMVIGILPVIGIPLPLISYGGSSLLTNMLMLGIVMNVYRNQKEA